ncbi:MAG: exo-alpha-sialidase [Verrucomicrobiaceae bacterium]|nr:exo-alpha-sialidase [Verrucomicrobiaceae bacterium]
MKHILLSLLILPLALAAQVQVQVQVESLPEPGIQPQVIVTSTGLVHLVYLKGDSKACDIRYASRRADGGAWSAPITVNSEPRSAIAAGTIRGAQVALGKDGSVQVIWNGNTGGKKDMMMRAPLLHARLPSGAKAFSAQQNLIGDTTALDGGASIAANEKGHVSVVWHAAPAGASGEAQRLVYVRSSTDDGGTFSAPTPLNEQQPGVCACCSLRAHLAADGTLSVLYRAATAPTTRGMWFITSKASRSTLTKLDDWRVAMCPMSSASLLPAAQTLRAAWENDGQIITSLMSAPSSEAQKIGPRNAKHPVLAQNAQGRTIIASVIGSGWGKAGNLHWDVLDAEGHVTASGDGTKLPVSSYAAAYAKPDGSFVILR